MNLRKNQKGFTIVELLIVVVVIAILAAISIVAYTGITARANNSASMEAASSVRSVAVTFQGTQGKYPVSKAEMVSGFAASGGSSADALAKLPADIVFKAGLPVASDSPKTIAVAPHGSLAAPTGLTIYYWQYTPTASVQSFVIGDGGPVASTWLP